MGLADWLGKGIVCPVCRQKGAQKFAGKVKCANPTCANYDPAYADKSAAKGVSATSSAAPLPSHSGNFMPKSSVEIRYRNFRGDDQRYVGDETTLRDRRNFISICLVPTGRRVAFARKWIKNLSSLHIPDPAAVPTGRERHVLNYHKKRHSTSPLYERLRAKYPDY